MQHRGVLGAPARQRLGFVMTALAAGAGLAVAGSTPAGAEPTPHAQYLNLQWGLNATGAPSVWQYGTGAGIRIGIVDTGVDFAQQDLQGKVVASTAIVSNPSSGCASPQSAQDDNGHGTHVAGIAAASGAHGVDGAAPGASLVVAKVLDCQGGGSYQDVAAGINWVVSQGARVVNLSLGDAGTGLVDQSQITGNPLGAALQNAWNHGAIGVVAAGNNSNGVLGLGEANFANVPAVVVAATGPDGSLASYSNSIDQAQWGIAAPGGDDSAGPTTPTCSAYDSTEILSTYWTQADPTACYATDEGTSMATPFVSGTLALLLGRGLSPTQAVQTLLGTAAHSVSCGSACAGSLNAAAAVQSTVGRPAPPPTSPPPPPRPAPGSTTTSGHAPGTAASATTSPPTTGPATAALHNAPMTTGPAPRAAQRSQAARHDQGGGPSWWLALLIPLALAAAAAMAVVVRRMLASEPPAEAAEP